MAVKLTKNEQKKQKDALKQYNRYLPTLQLKKQQLQVVIRQSEAEIVSLREEQKKAVSGMDDWIGVYSANIPLGKEKSIGNLIKVKSISLDEGNIAVLKCQSSRNSCLRKSNMTLENFLFGLIVPYLHFVILQNMML